MSRAATIYRITEIGNLEQTCVTFYCFLSQGELIDDSSTLWADESSAYTRLTGKADKIFVQLNNKDNSYCTDTEEDIVDLPDENATCIEEKETGFPIRAGSPVICDDIDLYGECDELLYLDENNRNLLERNHNNTKEHYGQPHQQRLVAFTQNETEVCLKARQKVLAWNGISVSPVTLQMCFEDIQFLCFKAKQ